MSPTPESCTPLTENAHLVLAIVRERGSGKHLTTSDVFVRARERRPEIGYSTVYRALQRLRDLEMVDEIVLPGTESAYYEPASPPHAHFRCRDCGEILDVAYVVAMRTLRTLARRYDVDVDEATLTLQGRCKDCRG